MDAAALGNRESDSTVDSSGRLWKNERGLLIRESRVRIPHGLPGPPRAPVFFCRPPAAQRRRVVRGGAVVNSRRGADGAQLRV